MENSGCRRRFIWFCLAFFLLICGANAENKTDPTDNLNLTPFSRWRSAYYCLQNVSSDCKNYTLSLGGWLNVSHSDGQYFCRAGGCADHTRAVLTCIHSVKPDFWFSNKATVSQLNDTINIGCNTAQGFNGTSLYLKSGYQKISAASMISTLLALVVVTLSLFYV